MKVMITYPPLKSEKGFPLLSQNRQFQWFSNPALIYPMIPASAATLLDRKGFEVIWKDAIAEGMSWEDYKTLIREAAPDLVAIETKTPVIKMHWKIIDSLKKVSPKTRFVLMGDHVTALPKESMENCGGLDYIITGGDFDFSLLELCRHIQGKGSMPKGLWYRKGNKIMNSGKFELNHNLDDLPMIDRVLTMGHLYNKEYNIKRRPFAYTMAGRDCPWHRCKFCAWPTLFPKFRVRSPGKLLDEIGMLIDRYNVREVFDDTGTLPIGKWLEDFCRGMVERGYNKRIRFSCNMRVDYMTEENTRLMKKAGFRLLKIGLESANQKTLDRINKGIKAEQIERACRLAKKAGLEIHLTMIVGYPWETKEDALRTYALADRLMSSGLADVLQSTVLVPYPGSGLYKEALESDWFRVDPHDYERYDMREPVLKSPDMTPGEVMGVCNMIYSTFTSPKYVIRKLLSIRSLSDIRYLIDGLKAVIGHKRDFSNRGSC